MNINFLKASVDELGQIKANIAALKEAETRIKKELIGSGLTSLEGNLFRVSISDSERKTLHAETARSYLTEDQIYDCTKTTKVVTVKCSARNGT